jgi:rare lipoprotein A
MTSIRYALVALMLAVAHPAFADDPGKVEQQGKASYYSDRLQGHKTASGKPMKQSGMTAASRTLPLGAKAKVTNLETGKTADVTVNDRGPYARGRIVDVSKEAASKLDMKHDGVAPVKVEAKPSDQPTPELRQKVEQAARH